MNETETEILTSLTDEETIETAEGIWGIVSPYLDWIGEHWLVLVLTGEIIGAVLAIKFRHYYRGLGWLAAALATVWAGVLRTDGIFPGRFLSKKVLEMQNHAGSKKMTDNGTEMRPPGSDEAKLRRLVFEDFSTESVVELACKRFDPNYLGAYGRREAIISYLKELSFLYGLNLSETVLEKIGDEAHERCKA